MNVELALKAKAVSDELIHESDTIMQIVRERPEFAPMYQRRMTEISQEVGMIFLIVKAVAAQQQMEE